jgi:hypothetical protein
MSAMTSAIPARRNSLLGSIVLGGTIIGIVHLIVQEWLIFSVVGKTPLLVVLQYIASGLLGNASFAGGIGTALLGVLFHLVISYVVAAVFILAAGQIPFLRRNVIVASLVYGLAVFVVLNYGIIPLSATPPIPGWTLPQLIELLIEHALLSGLTLGLIVRRNMKAGG